MCVAERTSPAALLGEAIRLRYAASLELRRRPFAQLFSCTGAGAQHGATSPCDARRHVRIGDVRAVSTAAEHPWAMTEAPVTLDWSLVPAPAPAAAPPAAEAHRQLSLGRAAGGEEDVTARARLAVELSVLRRVLSPPEVERIVALLPEEFDLDGADVEMIPKRWVVVERASEALPGREALAGAMRPAVDGRILPFVRARLRCPDCLVCSSIVRRYAHSLGERYRDPPHTDGQAFATVVVALNSAGVDFDGGLYVVTDPVRPLSVALQAGDAVMHRWDLQHGVRIGWGRRLSWILWIQDSSPCVPQEELHQRPFLREAAESGHAVAMHILGGGASGRTPEGRRWLRRSAEAGFVKAMAQLGTSLQESDGRAAEGWLTAAALQGDVGAQAQLGILQLREGRAAAAEEWLERAAEGGHPMAQNELGMGLLVGSLGRAPDPGAAVPLLAAAARQGHSMAQTNLGFCYAEGRGVGRSLPAALYWWREAAAQGRSEALANLQQLQDANPGWAAWPVYAGS